MAFASSSDGKVSEPSIQPSHPCRRFEFSEILRATDNFAESLVIGKGGFGKVYKGNIMNGSSLSVAAIKRSDSISGQGAAEFWTEVEMLSMLRHCNLVSLIGYCIHEKEMILVYDYMPNGTLNDHLHKHHTPLSWLQRLNICIGVGRGLHYLHTGTGIGTGVIHRDVKSTNILLHESWAAKLSDFGLSKVGKTDQPVSTFVKGTFGYMDPSYFQTGKLTSKSDVYAFGVVMLEVLCRKRAVISLGETQQSLATWGLDSIKEGNLKHIVDSDIMGEISPKCLKKFVRIAERCLHDTPELRPTMAEVVFSLESTLAFQEKFNVKTGPISITVVGRIAQGIKAFAEGGYENIFRTIFEMVPDEKLVTHYACYISTSAGPVMGILYLSTAKLAFCSDNPLSYKVGEETQWSYYKVVIPLYQLKAVNASKSKANMEKYIQIISVDSHEFWFMGFVNYGSAVQNLQGALQSQHQV